MLLFAPRFLILFSFQNSEHLSFQNSEHLSFLTPDLSGEQLLGMHIDDMADKMVELVSTVDCSSRQCFR